MGTRSAEGFRRPAAAIMSRHLVRLGGACRPTLVTLACLIPLASAAAGQAGPPRLQVWVGPIDAVAAFASEAWGGRLSEEFLAIGQTLEADENGRWCPASSGYFIGWANNGVGYVFGPASRSDAVGRIPQLAAVAPRLAALFPNGDYKRVSVVLYSSESGCTALGVAGPDSATSQALASSFEADLGSIRDSAAACAADNNPAACAKRAGLDLAATSREAAQAFTALTGRGGLPPLTGGRVGKGGKGGGTSGTGDAASGGGGSGVLPGGNATLSAMFRVAQAIFPALTAFEAAAIAAYAIAPEQFTRLAEDATSGLEFTDVLPANIAEMVDKAARIAALANDLKDVAATLDRDGIDAALKHFAKEALETEEGRKAAVEALVRIGMPKEVAGPLVGVMARDGGIKGVVADVEARKRALLAAVEKRVREAVVREIRRTLERAIPEISKVGDVLAMFNEGRIGEQILAATRGEGTKGPVVLGDLGQKLLADRLATVLPASLQRDAREIARQLGEGQFRDAARSLLLSSSAGLSGNDRRIVADLLDGRVSEVTSRLAEEVLVRGGVDVAAARSLLHDGDLVQATHAQVFAETGLPFKDLYYYATVGGTAEEVRRLARRLADNPRYEGLAAALERRVITARDAALEVERRTLTLLRGNLELNTSAGLPSSSQVANGVERLGARALKSFAGRLVDANRVFAVLPGLLDTEGGPNDAARRALGVVFEADPVLHALLDGQPVAARELLAREAGEAIAAKLGLSATGAANVAEALTISDLEAIQSAVAGQIALRVGVPELAAGQELRVGLLAQIVEQRAARMGESVKAVETAAATVRSLWTSLWVQAHGFGVQR